MEVQCYLKLQIEHLYKACYLTRVITADGDKEVNDSA